MFTTLSNLPQHINARQNIYCLRQLFISPILHLPSSRHERTEILGIFYDRPWGLWTGRIMPMMKMDGTKGPHWRDQTRAHGDCTRLPRRDDHNFYPNWWDRTSSILPLPQQGEVDERWMSSLSNVCVLNNDHLQVEIRIRWMLAHANRWSQASNDDLRLVYTRLQGCSPAWASGPVGQWFLEIIVGSELIYSYSSDTFCP